MQHPIDPSIDFNSIRDAIESMLVGRDQLVDDRDMQNILIAILEYSRQQRAVCQNPYINNATNTWYVYDSNGNPYDTNVSAEGTIIRQTEAQSIEGDPRVTLAQIDPMKPNEMKMTIYIPKGERGESGSVVTIVDGYWYIDGVNTGVVATGEAPTISEDGYWVVGGEKTEFKAVGTDGRDGYSPTATVVKTGDTATIEITDKNGSTTATVSDGFSPEVEVIQGDNSATINITDKTGQHTATISGLNGSYVPLYSTEKDWENRANWGNHYRVLMYGKQGYIECYSTGIVPIYMCPRYQPPKLVTYTGNLNGQCYDKDGAQTNVTLLCSTYLNTGNSCNIHEIDNLDTNIIDSGYITYNGLKCDPGTTFKGVENVTTFTSTNGAKVYTYPFTEQFVEIENGNIKKDAKYIVIGGSRSYVTYSGVDYTLNTVFTGVENAIDFAPMNGAKVYAYPLEEPPVEIESENIEKNVNYIVIWNEAYITLSDYIKAYNNKDFIRESKKIRYLKSLNNNTDISNFKVKVQNLDTLPTIEGTGVRKNGQLVSTNYNIDQKGNLDNETYGHLFPLRANKTYQIRVYLNKTYEKTYSENNSEIVTGNINPNEYYTVIGGSGSRIKYNNSYYYPEDIFKGVQDKTFEPIGGAKVYKTYLNPLTEQPVKIASGKIQEGVYYTVIEEGYSYITYNGSDYYPNSVFTGVENVIDFTSEGGAKVYTSPFTESSAEIGHGGIQEGVEYVVKEGEPYITYNDTEYYPGDIFRGIKGVIDFTPSGKAKVYTSVQPNGNVSVSTSKPWKQEERLLMFYTDDKAKISNYCYDFYGNLSKYDNTSNEEGWEWRIGEYDVSYGIFKVLSINGDLFFAVDMRNVDINNSADSEDIYGNWESVENEHSGDTTKDIANFTLLLDVVENDLTPVTTNNDSPAIEQS